MGFVSIVRRTPEHSQVTHLSFCSVAYMLHLCSIFDLPKLSDLERAPLLNQVFSASTGNLDTVTAEARKGSPDAAASIDD
jgi:hypothetical protein